MTDPPAEDRRRELLEVASRIMGDLFSGCHIAEPGNAPCLSELAVWAVEHAQALIAEVDKRMEADDD